jgi:hypothetical protein
MAKPFLQPLSLTDLHDLQDANRPAGENESRIRGGIMNDQGVHRIAVFGLGGGHETPVVGIGEADHQRFGQYERLELGIVFELCPAAPRGFNHRVDMFAISLGRNLLEAGHFATPDNAYRAPTFRDGVNGGQPRQKSSAGCARFE